MSVNPFDDDNGSFFVLATNRLTVGASNIAAGDTIQRSVDLINQGTINLASVSLTTSATTSSLLNTDTTNGLQMAIDKCSVPWTRRGSAPAYTYTCSGSTYLPCSPRRRWSAPTSRSRT